MQNLKTPFVKKALNAVPAWLVWLMPFIWMALIFYFSSQPSLPHLPAGWLDLIVKKLAHATAYGILFLFWKNAFNRTKLHPDLILMLALILTLGYAISDEWHQTFVTGRHGQIFDVGVDMVGAFVAAFSTKRRKKPTIETMPH